ncbi:DUF411 domain-containing protein [Roseateles sp.]|uniref:DUF411 domain-containing protein n=1 Tax=Roseateles sp. TaxID=1971397 RepID=UPI0032640B46
MQTTNTEHRRQVLLFGVALALLPRFVWAQASSQPPVMTVWKDPSCGCCKVWVEHLRSKGLDVLVRDTGNVAARRRLGVPAGLSSCHTAEVAGYVVEGHVPVREIQRLLKEKPDALGLTVPSMPVGSPGMDGPEYGGRKDAYQVLLMTKDGGTRVYQSYP